VSHFKAKYELTNDRRFLAGTGSNAHITQHTYNT